MYKKIITKEDELKKLLRQQTNYSYGKLRKMLKFKNDVELMNFLIEFLDKKLEEFNFETEEFRNKYLIKLVKYYDYSLGKIKLDNLKDNLEENSLFQITNKLNRLKKKINYTIDSSDNLYLTNERVNNKILLNKISEGIDISLQKMKNRINLVYGVEPLMDKNLDVLLKEVICNYQNTEYLTYIINEFPDAIYLKEGKRFIFENVLDKYFNILINKNNNNERLYYKKVVDLFLEKEAKNKTDDNELLKWVYLKRVDKLLLGLENSFLTDDKKKLIMETVKEEIEHLDNPNSEKIEIADLVIKEKEDSIISEYFKSHEKVQREDLTDRYVVTLDTSDTKIFENAISMEKLEDDKYLLSIYAVDVESYINSGNDYYKKSGAMAISNAEDKIFKNKMMKKRLSLVKDKVMPVYAYDFVVDGDMNLVDSNLGSNFRRANIKVAENIYFNEINDYRKKGSKELQGVIGNLMKVAYDEQGSKEYYISPNTANNMIGMFNCFATDTIVDYVKENNLPIIYFRSDQSIIDEISSLDMNNNNLSLLVQRLNEVYYNKDKDVIYTIGNDRVDSGDNLHMRLFSPLRRIDAMVNQMLIGKYLVEERKPEENVVCALERDLDKIAGAININKELGINHSNVVNKVYTKV